MRNLTLGVLLILLSVQGLAQSFDDPAFKKKFNKADALVYDGAYLEALPLLEDLYKYDTLNANLNYLLGVCYLMGKKDHDKAIRFLENATRNVAQPEMYQEGNWKERKAPGITYYYLGKAYHFKNRFDRAITNYYNYRSFISLDDVETYNQVRQQIQYAENAMELVKNPVGVKVMNLGPDINTEYPEYCPVVSADEKVLIFTSRRPGSGSGAVDDDGRYFEDIYICRKQPNGKWSKPKSIGSNINSPGHEAAIGLSPDGQLLFIYKDDNNDGNIYYSQRTADGWSDPQPLGSDINTPAWETHASITATQDLLVFTSNRSEGGYGGRDLWYSKRLPNGEWGLAMNMGSVINTEFEEDSPFITADGNTLIFSSQGHTSMGGFDIFRSEFVDGAWTVPENIGYPINSGEDDVFFVLLPDGRTAYYSSRRDGGFGDTDIYKLKLQEQKAPMLAVARGSMQVPAMQYADIHAKIEVTDQGGAVVGVYRPNPSTGFYVLVLQPGETYNISYQADGYEPVVSQLPIDESESYQEYGGVIELDEVVFGEDILALQKETRRLEAEKAELEAQAAEQERLAAEAEAKAKEEAAALALAAEKEAERKKAEELAAKEKAEQEAALAAAEEKARQAELERKKAEAKARFEAEQKAAEEARLKQEAELAAKQLAEQQAAEEAARKQAEELAAKQKAEEEAALAAAEEQARQAQLEREKAEQKAAEEARLKQEAELAAAEEQARQAELERKKAEELAAEQQTAEETVLATELASTPEQAELSVDVEEQENEQVENVAETISSEQQQVEEVVQPEVVQQQPDAEQLAQAQAQREAEAERKRKELQERIAALKAQKQKQQQQEDAQPAEQEVAVKEVAVQETVAVVEQEPAVDAAAIEAKRQEMIQRIAQLKQRRAEIEQAKQADEVALNQAAQKKQTAQQKKQELEQKAEKTKKEIRQLETVLVEVEEQVQQAEVEIREAEKEIVQTEDKLAEAVIEEQRIAEEEQQKEKEVEEAAKQLKELEELERQRLEQERLAAEEFEKEQQREADRVKQELIQLEALAEQQSQVEAAMRVEEEKRKKIEAAESDAYSQQEKLRNATTLEQLRELNEQLIRDNLDLKKQLVELNAKLDLILQRLDNQPDPEKVEMPASSTLKSLQAGRHLVLRNIFFDYNQATLRPRSKHELNKLYDFLKDNPDVNIEVSGHTDSRGNDDYNMRLSQERAQAVVDYLVRNGIEAHRLKAIGYGETRPIARNENDDLTDNPVGRQLNRRIEISLPKADLYGVEVEKIEVPESARIDR